MPKEGPGTEPNTWQIQFGEDVYKKLEWLRERDKAELKLDIFMKALDFYEKISERQLRHEGSQIAIVKDGKVIEVIES